MKQIAFSVSIYPSMARPGHFAVSISSPEGSIVLGVTKEVDKVKEAWSSVISEGSEWVHDNALNVHTMEINHPL